MSLFSAISSIALMTMLYLFGPRDLNQEKDFLHLSPPRILRFVLYVRRVPKGKIPLASIAIQCLSILSISFQLLSIAIPNGASQYQLSGIDRAIQTAWEKGVEIITIVIN